MYGELFVSVKVVLRILVDLLWVVYGNLHVGFWWVARFRVSALGTCVGYFPGGLGLGLQIFCGRMVEG